MKDKEHCTGCGLCAAVCPAGAITLKPDRIGFLYPTLDKSKCTRCGLCDKTCDNIGGAPIENAKCFGVKARDPETRAFGSSGGMFPLLAMKILSEGGSVFGAALTEDGAVRHVRADTPEQLARVTRTKYVQSDLSGIWQELRRAADSGKPALFCGTPCQTAAVKEFLGNRRGGVILADLICNGVPSPGIWSRYLTFLKKRYGGEIEDYRFRDKRAKNSGHSVSFFAGGREYAYPLTEDPYCLSYLISVNIRESCLNCPFTAVDRVSDITIGDFWGIESVKPDFDDGMGCSAVICRTKEGEKLWEQIKSETESFQASAEQLANSRQPRLKKPTLPSRKRGLYLSLYGRLPFAVWIRLFGRKKQKPL